MRLCFPYSQFIRFYCMSLFMSKPGISIQAVAVNRRLEVLAVTSDGSMHPVAGLDNRCLRPHLLGGTEDAFPQGKEAPIDDARRGLPNEWAA